MPAHKPNGLTSQHRSNRVSLVRRARVRTDFAAHTFCVSYRVGVRLSGSDGMLLACEAEWAWRHIASMLLFTVSAVWSSLIGRFYAYLKTQNSLGCTLRTASNSDFGKKLSRQ